MCLFACLLSRAQALCSKLVETRLQQLYALGSCNNQLQEVLDLLADGVMTAATGKHEPLEKAPDAVRESMKPNRKGKVFLEG